MSGDVLQALKRSNLGKVCLDRYWTQEGNEIFDAAKFVKIDSVLLPSPHYEEAGNGRHENQRGQQSTQTERPNQDTTDVTWQCTEAPTTEIHIQLYEEERTDSVRESLQHRLALQEWQLRQWQEQASQKLSLLRLKLLQEQQRSIESLEKELLLELKDMAEENRKIKEQNRNHAMYMKSKIREAELLQKKAQEEDIRQSAACARKLQDLWQELRQLLELCQSRLIRIEQPDVKAEQGPLLQRMTQQLSQLCPVHPGMSKEELQRTMTLTQEMHSRAQAILADLDKREAKARTESAEKQKSITASTPTSVADSTSEPSSVPSAPQHTTTHTEEVACKTEKQQESTADISHQHTQLLQKLHEWRTSYQDLVEDKRRKQYRFDLMKAVSVSVNAVSTASAVKGKLDKLSALLNGKPFPLATRTVTCTEHPSARNFCLDKLAERIVSQGEEQINSNGDSAYPIAALALGLWCRFPELGDLLLGNLFMRCPALLPLYPSADSKENLELCGYRMNEDGTFETDAKYQRRISGFVRLYAAIVQTKAPEFCKGSHPLGVNHGWKFLASTLNIQPQQPALVASVLFNFLEVAGWAIGQAYGRQFIKLLHVLAKDYFPLLRGGGTSGPIARLEAFLQQVLRRGTVSRQEASLGDKPEPNIQSSYSTQSFGREMHFR